MIRTIIEDQHGIHFMFNHDMILKHVVDNECIANLHEYMYRNHAKVHRLSAPYYDSRMICRLGGADTLHNTHELLKNDKSLNSFIMIPMGNGRVVKKKILTLRSFIKRRRTTHEYFGLTH